LASIPGGERRVNWRFIRRYPDGHEEVWDINMNADVVAHTSETITDSEDGTVWKVVDVQPGLEQPTIIVELFDAE
jgi:hypothetical protein